MDPLAPRTHKILWLAHNPSWIVAPYSRLAIPPRSSLGILDYLLKGELSRMVATYAPMLKPGERIWLFLERSFFRGIYLCPIPGFTREEGILALIQELKHQLPPGPRVILPPPEWEGEVAPEFWYTLPQKLFDRSFPVEKGGYFVSLL